MKIHKDLNLLYKIGLNLKKRIKIMRMITMMMIFKIIKIKLEVDCSKLMISKILKEKCLILKNNLELLL